MPRPLFAAVLLACLPLCGCDDARDPADPTLDGAEGQFELEPGTAEDFDPNELPAEATAEDETMGDSRLGDPREEQPGTNEYDSLPLAPGDGAERD